MGAHNINILNKFITLLASMYMCTCVHTCAHAQASSEARGPVILAYAAGGDVDALDRDGSDPRAAIRVIYNRSIGLLIVLRAGTS